MPLPRDELQRLQRLRAGFLAGHAGAVPPDYWRDARDLAAYDAVFGARIGWKWDAALAESRDRGFARADGATVLDFGCGTGVAGRAFAAHCGAGEVLCHDRSPAAMAFAVERLRASHPAVAARALRSADDVAPDVLLVSHVLGELDGAGEAALRALIARSARVVWVEPGSRDVARRLSAIRDDVLGTFHAVAPCPHQRPCPALARDADWCHFFATPPPVVFTDARWAAVARELGIDLRSVPYSFLTLVRAPAPTLPPPPPHRALGRADVGRHDARLLLCTPDAPELVPATITKRARPDAWRALKKRPEALRHVP